MNKLGKAGMSTRAVGATELSWCRAVPGGTGITVLGVLLSKPPDLQNLKSGLHTLQNEHPILRTKLHYSPTTRSFSLVTTPAASSSTTLRIQTVDLHSSGIPNFEKLVEHELNLNPWKNCKNKADGSDSDSHELLEAPKVYELEGGRWAVVLKAHTAACDRSAGEAVLRDVVRVLMGGQPAAGLAGDHLINKMGSIEEYVPAAAAKRSLWARGVNLLGYSLNAFRLANIDFVDTRSPRSTRLLRLRLHPQVTTKLLQGCTSREIKLCGVLAAASLIAARRCNPRLPQTQRDKYGVTTIVDCRSLLHPPLTTHHLGFYHAAIMNTHEINGREQLWELAERTYKSFKASKKNNNHFSHMADLNFLMCRALDNPGLTPSSALRTSFVSVFEDEITYNNDPIATTGVDDYVACSSVHGVGPTLALFPTIRHGGLDCLCVYPGPLHSTNQMNALLHHMHTILVEATLPS